MAFGLTPLASVPPAHADGLDVIIDPIINSILGSVTSLDGLLGIDPTTGLDLAVPATDAAGATSGWESLFGDLTNPVSDAGSRRRSLYFVHSHNDHHKFLTMFDDASVLECYRRAESIVPQQALALANSQFALAMAEKINAVAYLECSAKSKEGERAVFETATGAALQVIITAN